MSSRFWAQVEKTDACWNWTGRTLRGYGRFSGRMAHRLSYEELVGTIPPGLTLDHLCRNTGCVRPDHLEPVTNAENMRRRYETYTHCVNGHEFTALNTYVRPDGHRDCRTCIRARVAAYKARRAAA